jgi:choice-of-anchor A domain-containing protein
MREPIRPVVAAGVLLLSAVAARATLLDAALVQFDQNVRNYNLVSFGNASFTSYGDTEGGLAVAGNLSLDGGALAAQPGKFGLTSDPTLYLGGALSLKNTAYLQSGYASISAAANAGWIWSAVDNRLTNAGATFSSVNTSDPLGDVDPRLNAGPSNWNFASLQTSFVGISQTLANATATGSITITGQTLRLTPTNPAAGVVVFDFDANLLSGNTYNGQLFSNVQFDVPAGDAFVVNVRNVGGRTLFGPGGINFNSGTGYEHLLWNIVDSTSDVVEDVRFGNGGQFFGAVLAPTFNVFNDLGTAVNGQVVAGSYSHSGAELHFTGFDYSYEVPEPGTYGLLGAAACGGLVLWRRVRRKRLPTARG